LKTTRGTVDAMMQSVIWASICFSSIRVLSQTKYWSAVRWCSVAVRQVASHFCPSQRAKTVLVLPQSMQRSMGPNLSRERTVQK